MDKENNVDWKKLIKSLTIDDLADLREEVIALDEALKRVPHSFDKSFQEKINTILHITSEVEKHAVNFQVELSKHVKDEITTCIKEAHSSNRQESFLSFLAKTLFSGVLAGSLTISFIVIYLD